MFRDEFAKFLIKSRKLISKDTAILRVTFPMLPGSWGEDFVPPNRFPKSFCVMVSRTDDPNQIKPYTPIDWTADHMDLLVKSYPLGRVSKYIFESKEGDTLLIKGPREKLNLDGLFHQERKPKRIIALAAGTGIAPIYQVLKYMDEAKNTQVSNTPVVLIYANKSSEDILLKSELLSLKLPRLEIRHVLESERRSDTDKGYVRLEDIPEAVNGDYVVMCGPSGFRDLLLGSPTAETKNSGFLGQRSYTKEQIYKF